MIDLNLLKSRILNEPSVIVHGRDLDSTMEVLRMYSDSESNLEDFTKSYLSDYVGVNVDIYVRNDGWTELLKHDASPY